MIPLPPPLYLLPLFCAISCSKGCGAKKSFLSTSSQPMAAGGCGVRVVRSDISLFLKQLSQIKWFQFLASMFTLDTNLWAVSLAT